MTDLGVINFFSGKKEYRSLSNFWENDVVVDKRLYESGEHCFQGEKYTRLGEICDEPRKSVLLEYGRTFMKPSPYTAAMAKKMGRRLVLTTTELEQWTSISIEVQHGICAWKWTHYEEVKHDLLKSGNKILIHPAMRCSQPEKRLWEGKGVIVDGKLVILGKNMLGTIWMTYRPSETMYL
jgi:predicted NAD-dependent protein-ADP-ribosyltransferase YbiA (DUF1768 family)